MIHGLSLYKEITKIAEDYFGPVAPRFINRIVTSHLHKEPDQITSSDMPELVNWIKLCAAVMTEETETIDEFVGRLNILADAPKV